jgi:DNA repair photolyase
MVDHRSNADIPNDELPERPRKGRGAIANPASRFDAESRVALDDGWPAGEPDPDLPPLRTTVMADATRTIIARNDSPDIPFDQSINPYRGCEHGCIYCFARPSHAYLGFSPGLDFETRLVAKFTAPALLENELRARNYVCQPIALGTNTDPYQPIEREHRITRGILEVLSRFRNPVTIVTKSALVERDIDILAPMAQEGLARVCLTVTTLDRDLARRMEPRASTPPRRLAAIKALAAAGIPVGVLSAPMIPSLNDHEMEAILEQGRQAGATMAGYTFLRLPLELKQLFQEWLEEHAPARADRVMSLIRQSRGGALYKAEFGRRMVGEGPYAALLQKRFHLACKKLNLNTTRWQLDTSRFAPPPRPGDQLKLF